MWWLRWWNVEGSGGLVGAVCGLVGEVSEHAPRSDRTAPALEMRSKKELWTFEGAIGKPSSGCSPQRSPHTPGHQQQLPAATSSRKKQQQQNRAGRVRSSSKQHLAELRKEIKESSAHIPGAVWSTQRRLHVHHAEERGSVSRPC